MKGVVFTQFIEFIEEEFGFDVLDEMIDSSETSTNGVFTQAGNYPFEDLFKMIQQLSKITNVPIADLVNAYGKHLFSVLITIYPKPIAMYDNTFDFIANVEQVVHPEVKKLYPDSDLPTFEPVSREETILQVKYISTKPLMDFAKGLMQGCAQHYNENIDVSYEIVNTSDKHEAIFTLNKN